MVVAPRERSGIASATMNALRQSGMTISIALLGTVLAHYCNRVAHEAP